VTLRECIRPSTCRRRSPAPPARLAAALALGAALGAADCKKDTPTAGGEREIEVRTAPPKIAAPPADVAEPDESDASAESTDVAIDAERDAAVALPDTVADIEVRVAPPQVAAPMVDMVAPPAVDASGDVPTETAPEAAPADAAVELQEDAARRARDARTHRPPPIEVRDMPPFVNEKK
jgi:hypothetical protein